jgi:hypothetical protein
LFNTENPINVDNLFGAGLVLSIYLGDGISFFCSTVGGISFFCFNFDALFVLL